MKKYLPMHNLVKKITIAPDDDALSKIFSSLDPNKAGKPVRVAFINAHALNLCWSDDFFMSHLMESDYVFRDGAGMKILFRMLGRNPGLNLNGTDLIPRILTLYAGNSVALFGTKHPYLQQAASVMQKNDIKPSLLIDGFQDDRIYLEAARNYPSSLIILGMGMPKQERIASLLAENLDYPCLILCGGAILDFMGGKVSRAPVIFRRMGIEWVYRFAKEPRRLFRRYMVGNFVFLYRSLLLSLPSEQMKNPSG